MTKQVLLAMRIYAGQHNDQYPTNLDQLLGEGLLSTTNFIGGVTTGDIQFMNAGLVNDSMPNVIAFRESVPHQAPDGEWMRVYGFGDGSVQVVSSSDGNYDAFEIQHMPPTQNQ